MVRKISMGACLGSNPCFEVYNGGEFSSEGKYTQSERPLIMAPLRSQFEIGCPLNQEEGRIVNAGCLVEKPVFYNSRLILPLMPVEWIAPTQGYLSLKACDTENMHGAVIAGKEGTRLVGVGEVNMFNLMDVIKIVYTHRGNHPKGGDNIPTKVFHNSSVRTLDKIGEEAEFSLSDLKNPAYLQIGVRKAPIDGDWNRWGDIVGYVIKLCDTYTENI